MKTITLLSGALLASLMILVPPAHAQGGWKEFPGMEIRHGWKSRLATAARARTDAERGASALMRTPAQAKAGAVSGTLALPVIIVRYPESSVPILPQDVQDRISGKPTGALSADQFWAQMSGGQFRISSQAAAPVVLPLPSSYYVGTRQLNGVADHLKEFLLDAFSRSEGLLDWRNFDNDGADGVPNSGDDDGRVDAAVIVYVSQDGSCTSANNGQMWAHRWNLTEATGAAFTTTRTGALGKKIVVDDYIAVSAVECTGQGYAPMGLLIHELGHVLGLPDLYAVGNATSEGVGEWDLMGSGNWLTPEYPAGLGAWSRMMLGWANVSTLSDHAGYVLPSVHDSTGRIVRINGKSGTGNFVLLEVRHPTSLADRDIRGSGILLWQIDTARLAATIGDNRVNSDPNRPSITLVQADGRRDLERGSNRSDAEDLWGSTGKTSFAPGSVPAAVVLGGTAPLGFRIDNMRYDAVLRAASFDVTTGDTLYADVSVSASLPGVHAYVNDTLRALPWTSRRSVGSTLRIQIDTSSQSGSRLRFVRWENMDTVSLRTIGISDRTAQNIRADVDREHYVNIRTSNPARGSVSATVAAWVRDGQWVTLRATAAPGYKFLFWQDSSAVAVRALPFLASDSVKVTTAISAVARFSPPVPAGMRIENAVLLGPAAIDRDVQMYLDAYGNGNGAIDSGDLLLLVRKGRLLLGAAGLTWVDPLSAGAPQP